MPLWRILQWIGTGLAVLTALLAFEVVALVTQVFGMLRILGIEAQAGSPMIGVRSGVAYSMAILALGVYSIWNAKWSAFGLMTCAAVGLLFSPRNPTIPVLAFVAAVFCLWSWKARQRAERRG